MSRRALGPQFDGPEVWRPGPMTLYHGTKREYNVPSMLNDGIRASSDGESGAGVYTTPDLHTATKHALAWDHKTEGYKPGIVLGVQHDPGRVLDRNTPEGEKIFQDTRLDEQMNPNRKRDANGLSISDTHERLMSKGYDAVRHNHGRQHEVVLLNPHQVPRWGRVQGE